MSRELARVKKLFFDKSRIGEYLDKKTFKVLNQFGGSVRKTAQRSMRSRKGSQKSGSGKPPYAHGRRLLRKLLFYSLNKDDKSVVVGPVMLNETRSIGVPRLMEEGGRVAATVKGKTVMKDYRGNPYMIPAKDVYIGKVAGWYKQV